MSLTKLSEIYFKQGHPQSPVDGPPRVLRLADEVCESLQGLDVFLDGEERHQVSAVRRGDQDGEQPESADHHSSWGGNRRKRTV